MRVCYIFVRSCEWVWVCTRTTPTSVLFLVFQRLLLCGTFLSLKHCVLCLFMILWVNNSNLTSFLFFIVLEFSVWLSQRECTQFRIASSGYVCMRFCACAHVCAWYVLCICIVCVWTRAHSHTPTSPYHIHTQHAHARHRCITQKHATLTHMRGSCVRVHLCEHTLT